MKPNCFQKQIGNTDYFFSFCKPCQAFTIFHSDDDTNKPLRFYHHINAYLCKTCIEKICTQNIINMTTNNAQENVHLYKINGLIMDIYKMADDITDHEINDKSKPKRIVTYEYNGQTIGEITLQPGIATD